MRRSPPEGRRCGRSGGLGIAASRVSVGASIVAGVSTALYRRYRPETFAEVIGQEHVTGPLMQALRSGRVHHAYLFSGPRGCGKTTSARILARTLNCARNTPENPLDTPCGECSSCVELARGGPGSLDVVEIDAASHNGVDDARDLRERATFAPARDRYKIFILDEAHMVTPQGFNALLKIVEEPPPHIKFIFATTEPDKVIGTIRSRTHHYPFRLVPPDVLGPYLEQLCAAEGVSVGGGVVPLVTRAGGGSVRDSLSVMDQLIAGASGGVVDYDLAVGLLGFTHATLLDDVVEALAVRDGASMFRVVDHIVATGHEPRRFVEDVLERLRDLMVIAVSGDAADAVLRGMPADQLERMRAQAAHLGLAELSRAADLTNAALTEMTGATSPRLHLELLCARLLLPGADDGAAGLAARVERLERGGLVAAVPGSGPTAVARGPVDDVPASAPTGAGGLSGAAAARAARAGLAGTRAGGGDVAPSASAPDAGAAAPEPAPAVAGAAAREPSTAVEPSAEPVPVEAEPVGVVTAPAAPAAPAVPAAPVAPAVASASSPDPAPPADGGITTEVVRRRWDEVLGALQSARVTWSLVGPNAQVASLDGGTLRLSFGAPGLARAFGNPRHVSAVEDAVYQTLGLRVKVEAIVGDVPPSAGGGPAGPAPAGPGPGDGGGDGGAVSPRTGGSGGSAASGGNAAPGGGAAPGGSAAPSGGAGGGAPGGPVAPAAADSSDTAWPEVPPPGGRAATAPIASVTVPAVESNGARAVAVVDRPASNRAGAKSTRTASAPAASAAADQAWLAGAPLSEPPPDYDDGPEPEPVYEDSAPTSAKTAAPGRAATAAAPDPAPATPVHSAAASGASGTNGASGANGAPATGGARAREMLRQAAERRAAGAPPARGASGSATPRATGPASDTMADDEPSVDDPDITSAGLMGVPLVVQVLGGTVIDEIVEQG